VSILCWLSSDLVSVVVWIVGLGSTVGSRDYWLVVVGGLVCDGMVLCLSVGCEVYLLCCGLLRVPRCAVWFLVSRVWSGVRVLFVICLVYMRFYSVVVRVLLLVELMVWESGWKKKVLLLLRVSSTFLCIGESLILLGLGKVRWVVLVRCSEIYLLLLGSVLCLY